MPIINPVSADPTSANTVVYRQSVTIQSQISCFTCACQDDGQPPIKKTVTVTAATSFAHGTVLASSDGTNYAPPSPGGLYWGWAVVDAEPILLNTDVLPVVKEITLRRAAQVYENKLVWPASFTTQAQKDRSISFMVAQNFTTIKPYNV